MLANIGIPMMLPELSLMGIALLPVILIEVAIVRRRISVPVPRAILDVGLANACTTLLGVPLAWQLMLGLDALTTGGGALGMDTPAKMLAAVTLQAAWLVPYEDHVHWMVPAAATALLIPCFLVSVIIERWLLIWRWRDHDRRAVSSAVLWANIGSYLLLFAAGSLWCVFSSFGILRG